MIATMGNSNSSNSNNNNSTRMLIKDWRLGGDKLSDYPPGKTPMVTGARWQ